MRIRLAIVAVGLAVFALAMAPSAGAAVEIGSHCIGDTSSGNKTLVQISNDPSDPLSAVAPGAGVVTSWSVNMAPISSLLPEKLKIFRATTGSNHFSVIAESRFEAVPGGQSNFATRLPIQAGDRIGVYAGASSGPLFCSLTGKESDVLGSVEGDAAVGSTLAFLPDDFNQVAVAATIEPDRDGDGYGDETQDGCPQSAAYQAPCPTIALDAFPIVLKRSVLVLVSASSESSVRVFGQVGWKPRHKGGALASKTGKPGGNVSTGVIVGLSGGQTTVRPGEVTPFNVKLPKSVIRHLNQIPPKQFVKGTITAQTSDLAGRAVEHTITVRLHGRRPSHS